MNTLRAVVLVEGISDRVALHTVAERRGRNLAAEGVDVVAMGGITNTRAFASRYGVHGLGVPLVGLYDAAEEAKLRHGLAAAGLVAASSLTDCQVWASTSARRIWRTSSFGRSARASTAANGSGTRRGHWCSR